MRLLFRSGFRGRTILYVLLFLLLSAWLAWLLLEPVRQFVALPLEFLAWLVKTLYLLVPRYLWWVIFLLIGYVIAFNGLMSRTAQREWTTRTSSEQYAEPHVARLTRYIRLRKNPFYRHRLNHLISEVALRALAYREQASLHQVRQAVHRGAVAVPSRIAAYLQAGLPPWPDVSAPPPGLLERWFPARQKTSADLPEAEEVLDFLEDMLEVPRDH